LGIKIHVLTGPDLISYYFYFPLLVNREKLRQSGIRIRYFKEIEENIYDCDLILLDSKYFRPLWRDRDYVFTILGRMREKSQNLVWMDTTDSTGTTHFQVMPYVDKYWKKHLLKNRNLYELRYYGARIYTDYNHKNFHCGPPEAASVDPIQKQYLNKLAISWNLAMGPVAVDHRISRLIAALPWPLKERLHFHYRPKYHSPQGKRAQPVSFRGTSAYSSEATAFQRLKTIDKLKVRGVRTEPLGYRQYMTELRNSQIAVSPFGHGETCFRDFEIIQAGAMLFKPDMEHLETWPPLLFKDETYVAFRWDFSDFDSRLDSLLQNPSRIVRIGSQAQQGSQYYVSKGGREEFRRHFLDLIQSGLTS